MVYRDKRGFETSFANAHQSDAYYFYSSNHNKKLTVRHPETLNKQKSNTTTAPHRGTKPEATDDKIGVDLQPWRKGEKRRSIGLRQQQTPQRSKDVGLGGGNVLPSVKRSTLDALLVLPRSIYVLPGSLTSGGSCGCCRRQRAIKYC